MLWCEMFNLYAEVDSNMPIPQMIRTSTSWLNTTNPEHFTSFYTKAWTWFNSCFVNFKTFYLSWCPKGKRSTSLAERCKCKFTVTSNGEGLHITSPSPGPRTSQQRSQRLLWKMVFSPTAQKLPRRPKWGTQHPAGPLNNSDKKGNRHSTRQR